MSANVLCLKTPNMNARNPQTRTSLWSLICVLPFSVYLSPVKFTSCSNVYITDSPLLSSLKKATVSCTYGHIQLSIHFLSFRSFKWAILWDVCSFSDIAFEFSCANRPYWRLFFTQIFLSSFWISARLKHRNIRETQRFRHRKNS